MSWASQPTTEMPADIPRPIEPRWSRRRVVASVIAVGGLAGYDIGGGWAENIAYGQATAADVMAAWLRSAEHRGNIVDCSLRAVGIGAARDMSGQIYWTQDFGGR